MPHSDTDARPPHAGVIDVDGVPMSTLACEVERPRAVLLALHGGATTSTYYDCPGRPDLSLLRTAAALGYTAIALDRPGYGASARHAEEVADTTRQIDLGFAAVDALLSTRPRGAGVFLLGHSAGCELATRMAADERGREFIGLEIAGTGLHHQWTVTNVLDSMERDTATGRRLPRGLRAMLWGPRRLYAPDVYSDPSISARAPGYEIHVRHWVNGLPELAARVRVPVHLTLGDHETVWRSGPDALAEVAALFTASPRVRTHEQTEAGHNLSLGLTARAYHLHILSFLEECAVFGQADGDQLRASAAAR
ncbi:alpha/beta hydrolase [Streptomyces sp. NPDC090075]|uniref:alpha/beta hydrolase n=1 Tax=Streptomyces sp. NPDC090075 TaxID=3365937 RepID=UPI00382ED32E